MVKKQLIVGLLVLGVVQAHEGHHDVEKLFDGKEFSIVNFKIDFLYSSILCRLPARPLRLIKNTDPIKRVELRSIIVSFL